MITAYTAFAEFMYRQAESLVTASLWLKISSFWPLSLAFLLHFALIFTRRLRLLKFRFSYGLIYIPMVLASIGGIFMMEPIQVYWGYTYQRTSAIAIIGILSSLYGISSSFLFIQYYFTIPDSTPKKQAKAIMIGQFFPFLSAFLGGTFIAGLAVPESITTCSVIFAGFTVYAIWKYQLFILEPATTAENIIQTMPDCLILINEDFEIQEVNRALLHLLEYERSALIGQPVSILLAEAEPGPGKIWADLYHQGLVQNVETKFKTSRGALIPVSIAGSVIKNKQEHIVGMVCIGTDTREIKQLQAQLFQSEKMAAIGQLAGGVAHEINNPIGVILGFAQSISKKITENDPLKLPLQSIEREAIRCKKLVGDLLTFSRSGKSQAEVIDMNQTIDETLSLIENRTKIEDIEVIKNFDTSLPPIMANKSQIQQVILNLCNNAIDAMPGGGKIIIITRHSAHQMEISISDTGQGIAEAIKQHLFEPFFTTKEVGKGTGLGLSLCYEIIQKHRGMIEVESEAGKGATFKVCLPINN